MNKIINKSLQHLKERVHIHSSSYATLMISYSSFVKMTDSLRNDRFFTESNTVIHGTTCLWLSKAKDTFKSEEGFSRMIVSFFLSFGTFAWNMSDSAIPNRGILLTGISTQDDLEWACCDAELPITLSCLCKPKLSGKNPTTRRRINNHANLSHII